MAMLVGLWRRRRRVGLCSLMFATPSSLFVGIGSPRRWSGMVRRSSCFVLRHRLAHTGLTKPRGKRDLYGFARVYSLTVPAVPEASAARHSCSQSLGQSRSIRIAAIRLDLDKLTVCLLAEQRSGPAVFCERASEGAPRSSKKTASRPGNWHGGRKVLRSLPVTRRSQVHDWRLSRPSQRGQSPVDRC